MRYRVIIKGDVTDVVVDADSKEQAKIKALSEVTRYIYDYIGLTVLDTRLIGDDDE